MFSRVEWRGGVASKEEGQQLSVPPVHPILAGEVLVVRGASDNAGSGGASEHNVHDERGNHYERLAESLGGGGEGGAAVELSTWLCNVAQEIRANDQGTSVDDPVALAVPAGVLAKAIGLEVFAVTPNHRAALVGSQAASGQGSGFSVSLGGLPVVAEGARLYVLHVGVEGDYGDVGLEEVDPSWSPVIMVALGTSGGNPRTNAACNFAYRFGGGPTDTGASYAGELRSARDWTAHLVALDEVPA